MSPRKFLLLYIFLAVLALSWLEAERSFSEEAALGSSEVDEADRSIMAAPILPKSEGPNIQVNSEISKILTLEECVEIAIKNNLPLKIANKNVKLAKWRLWETRRNMLPKVTVQWQEYTGKIYGRHFFGRKQSVDLQQTVFHGGEMFFTMKQAETNLKIVNREYARIKNDLILQVKKGYYTLAKAKENVRFQADLSREVLRIYDMVNKQSEAGITSNLEFLNVSSQTNQVKFQLASAKGDEEVANLILKQAMNMDMRESIDIEQPLEFKRIAVDFESVLADALVHRPEMQINSLMVSYYLYELKIAQSKSWPKIDLLGSFGLAKEEFISKDQGIDPAAGTVDADQKLEQQWYAGVKCSVPLWGSTTEYSYTKEVWVPVVSSLRGTETITNSVKFNFLDNLAQYSDKFSADVDAARAKQELIKTKQDVTLEAKESCFNYEKAILQLDTAVNKVRYQESDLELAKFRRQMDEIADSNVIESMIKLAQEKFGYTQALSDCNIAIASINKAAGIPDYFNNNQIHNDKK